MNPTNPPFFIEFRAALTAFVFAGLTGVWIRFAQLSGNWGTLEFANVRHAHSHLMLFVWATPIILMLMARSFIRAKTSVSGLQKRIRLSMIVGLATFLPFFHWGYQPAVWKNLRLPLSIVLSTLIIFTWYASALWYKRHRDALTLHIRQGWDFVIFSMIACTLGAWLRGVFTALKLSSSIYTHGAVQAFLTMMMDGWLIGGVVVAMSSELDLPLPKNARRLLYAGLPFSFLAYLADVPSSLELLGDISSVLFLVGIIWVLWVVRGSHARLSWWALMICSLARLVSLIPPVKEYALTSGIKIVLLHWIFLVVISTAAFEFWRQIQWSRLFAGASLLLVIGILSTTSAWPVGLWATPAWLPFITGALPVLVVILWLIRPLEPQKTVPYDVDHRDISDPE